MALSVNQDTRTFPKVYATDTLPGYWVAEGTDGNLYLVPHEPGGWMRRSVYDGQRTGLKSIPPQEATSSVWLIYGDIGPVTVAGSL